MTLTADRSVTTSEEESERRPDLAPEDIEASFAPCPRDSVVSSRFDDDVLIVDSVNGRIHVLNSTAALVWECFDGEATLDELAADLAAAFQAPLEEIRADTVEMTRQLGRLGLLAGVSLPVPKGTPIASMFEVGDELAAFAALAADGAEVELPASGKDGTLLVNWSPFCGYCAKIASDLGNCRPGLERQGVALAFLTAGTQEDNDRMLAPHGLSDAVFYRRATEESETEAEPRDPFGALGTPVAYLLDANGRLSEPLAYGSQEVLDLARATAGFSVTPPEEAAGPGQSAEESSAGPRRILPAASGVCGSAAVQVGKKPRQWEVTHPYAIGEFVLGIRADSVRTDDLVQRAFSSYRLAEPTPAPDNFSVVLGETAAAGTRALSLLLAADTTVLRSRSQVRVLRALAARLSSLLEGDAEGLLVTMNVAALVGDQAVLLPPIASVYMDHVQAKLARFGVRLSDEPHALVDPEKCELVIPKPRIEVAPEVLAELGEPAPSHSELPPLEPGRYRLGAWTFGEEPSRPSGTPTRAVAIAGVLPSVAGSPEQLGDLISAVARTLEGTRAVPLQWASPQELMRSIEDRLLD